MNMQILIPITSHSSFFPKEDFFFPKALVEVAGRPMIELVINQLKSQFKGSRFIFVIDQEDSRSFSLDKTLKLLAGTDCVLIERPGPTSGALCSCLLTVDSLNPEEPLIISNGDQIIEDDLSAFVSRLSQNGSEAGVATFESIHPRWSYVADDESGIVIQTFEKKVSSRNAIAGFYYFKTAGLFFNAAQKVIINDVHTDKQYYISSVLNEIILGDGIVEHQAINPRHYHSFYSPTKVDEFERTEYASKIREGRPTRATVNVIIPAAGEGSRFAKAGWKKPKPFIDLDGSPMLTHVIDNVTPHEAKVTLLLRKEHLNSHPKIARQIESVGHTIVSVAGLTEGTACTVLLAREAFDDNQPMMVANSDQLVKFNVNDYIQDCLERKLDGSILVFRDPSKDPKWSFARLDDNNLVVEVAEKKPISDLATVGIYLFAKGRDFINAALDMIVANDRVNNEFYTCPVYNYMIRQGARIGVYEVPMDSMSGLGTPDDLQSYLRSNNLPPSTDMPSN